MDSIPMETLDATFILKKQLAFAMSIFLLFFGALAAKSGPKTEQSIVKAYEGDTITLSCDDTIETEALHGVSWSKDDTKFFEYHPKQNPPVKVWPDEGFTLQKPNLALWEVVVLKDLKESASAQYTCEVQYRLRGLRIHRSYRSTLVIVLRKAENVSTETNVTVSQGPMGSATFRNSSTLPTTEILAGGFAFLFATVCAIVVFIYMQRQTLQMMLTKEELEQFQVGRAASGSDNEHGHDYCSIAYNKEKYEIGKTAFTIESSTLIGSGCFGLVYKASIPNYDKPVAVKVPKLSGKIELLSVLREIKLMSFVGEHENILKLVGAYTKEVQKGIVYVVTEFLDNGSLQDYLRRVQTTKNVGENKLQELHQFCLEISNGMNFLSIKKVIHGDLSTRNVLLDSSNTCKICDFGLSRKLYDMDLYRKTSSEPVPWKWMAVETLERSELSLKSDIWSLGVTFWEVYSFAEEPYQSLSWDLDFSKKLKNGLRLSKPEVADQSIYVTMLLCWELDAEKRPNAEYLISFFQSLKNSAYTSL